MKKLLLLFAFVFLVTGCTLEGDENKVDFTIQYLPVDKVEVPEFMTPGTTYALKLYYHRPNTCYYLNNNFYTAQAESALTIAIESVLLENEQCETPAAAVTESVIFNFACPLSQTGDTYTFKFFKGSDSNGRQQFMEVKVPMRL
jgi:hypothetical protein